MLAGAVSEWSTHPPRPPRRETLGDRHPDTLVSIYNMASLLQDQGKLVEAEALFCEAREAKRPE